MLIHLNCVFMNNKIVTVENCKVGDKIMYTNKWLGDNPGYVKYIKRNNVVYLIIKSKSNYTLEVDTINYKGIIVDECFRHSIREDLFVFYEW